MQSSYPIATPPSLYPEAISLISSSVMITPLSFVIAKRQHIDLLNQRMNVS